MLLGMSSQLFNWLDVFSILVDFYEEKCKSVIWPTAIVTTKTSLHMSKLYWQMLSFVPDAFKMLDIRNLGFSILQ